MRALLALICLTACAGPSAPTLRGSVALYNDSLRWGRYATAAQFVPVEERTAFLERYTAKEDDLHIDAMMVREVRPTDEDAYEVTVVAHAYVLPSTVLEKRVLVQRWEKQQEAWVLVRTDRELIPQNGL